MIYDWLLKKRLRSVLVLHGLFLVASILVLALPGRLAMGLGCFIFVVAAVVYLVAYCRLFQAVCVAHDQLNLSESEPDSPVSFVRYGYLILFPWIVLILVMMSANRPFPLPMLFLFPSLACISQMYSSSMCMVPDFLRPKVKGKAVSADQKRLLDSFGPEWGVRWR